MEYRQLGESDLRVPALALGVRNQAFTAEYTGIVESSLVGWALRAHAERMVGSAAPGP